MANVGFYLMGQKRHSSSIEGEDEEELSLGSPTQSVQCSMTSKRKHTQNDDRDSKRERERGRETEYNVEKEREREIQGCRDHDHEDAVKHGSMIKGHAGQRVCPRTCPPTYSESAWLPLFTSRLLCVAFFRNPGLGR